MGLDGYITFMANKDIPLWVKIVVHILGIAILVVVGMMYLLTKASNDKYEKRMAIAAAATVLVTKGGYFSKGVRSMFR
jgi:hypothetical protein